MGVIDTLNMCTSLKQMIFVIFIYIIGLASIVLIPLIILDLIGPEIRQTIIDAFMQ